MQGLQRHDRLAGLASMYDSLVAGSHDRAYGTSLGERLRGSQIVRKITKAWINSDSERRENPMIPLLFVFVAQSAPQKCALEGAVVSAMTGAPLSRATVTAWANRPGPKPSFTSSTDEAGRFSIGNLDAGTYSLRAERTGYIGENYGARSNGRIGTPLDLAAGQTMKDLTIQIAPEGMIYGRVLDDHGEPVPRMPVMVARRRFERGANHLVSFDSGMSQADGSFVLGGLTAGTYYVCALPQNAGSSVADREQPERPVFTCFPNAPDAPSAAAIQVGAGDRFRGAEIRLLRKRLYNINGRVQLPPEAPANPEIQVSLTGPVGSEVPSSTGGGLNKGKFEFRGLSPGTYVLHAHSMALDVTDPVTGVKATEFLTGKLEVTVADDEMSEAILPLAPGIAIQGKVRIEGALPGSPLPQGFFLPAVGLNAPDGEFIPNAEVDTQGTFRFHGVLPDKYHLRVYNPPEGTYVKSVRWNQDDVTGKDLDLISGGGSLDILLSPNVATVSGVVHNDDDKPATGVQVQIFLGDEFIRSDSTDQNGAFRFTSLGPGDYRVFAFEDIQSGLSSEKVFRKAFESTAALVKLEENSRESVELKVISKEAINAEAEKIR